MNRVQFDHAVRAAAAVVGESEVLVIGSQAIHASIEGDIPEAAMRSVEADIALFDDPEGIKADLVDGSIGEASLFHQSFGFYAQGVSIETAILPEGWEQRLVRHESPATNGVVAWCLSLEDLWVSKALAARPKDIEFCGALLERGMIVDLGKLGDLLEATKVDEAKVAIARRLLEGYRPGS